MLSLTILSGCWDKKEPKELAIITSSLVDVTDTGYKGYLDLLQPKNKSSDESPSLVYAIEGKTIAEAVRNVTKSIDRAPYGSEIQATFFSEAYARKGIKDYLTYLMRDNYADERPLIMIIKGTNPSLIYNSEIGLSKNVGAFIQSLSRVQTGTTSFSVFNNALDISKDYYNPGKQPVAGVVEIVPNPTYLENDGGYAGKSVRTKENMAVVQGLAVFKDDKLVDFMDNIETRAFNFLTNKSVKALVSAELEGAYITGTFENAKSDIKISFVDNIVHVDVKVKAKMSLIQIEAPLDPKDMQINKKIETAVNDLVKTEILQTIQKVQTLKTDIFGFGNYCHAQCPENWKNIKEQWDDQYFANAVISVQVNTIVDRNGETDKNRTE